MSSKHELRSSSSLDKKAFNRLLLDAFIQKDKQRKSIIKSVLINNAKNENIFAKLENGTISLSLNDIIEMAKALNAKGLAVDTKKLASQTPLAQQSFYQALTKSEYGYQILNELQRIRDEVKSEKGFLKTVFSINSSETPIEDIAKDAFEFEVFCQENNISYHEASKALQRNKTKFQKIKDFKFLIAAIAGTAAGLAGFDPAIYPVLNKAPGLFFTALPFFAVPFIGLNTFKAFSKRKLSEEAGTFLRFAGIMALGVSIGFTALAITGNSLGSLNTETIAEHTKAITNIIDAGSLINGADTLLENGMAWAGQYSPGKILMPVIGSAFGLSFLYKFARDKGLKTKSFLVSSFSKVSVETGDVIGTFANYFDKAFMGFVNVAGVPAIFLLLSTTLAQGGFEKFNQYAGYYGTVCLAMAGCACVILAAAYAYGQRAEGFKNLLKTFASAFSLSSSSATMPVTKAALAKMGVRERIRDAVVPLGATFNMMGTSLYLGLTAVAAAMMLGSQEISFGQQLSVMVTAIATAFGAPGIPASSIAFMSPVLDTLDMSKEQMSAVFAMIMLMDRPFDMLQTGLNVTGDMTVALDTEADAKGGGIKNNLIKVFNRVAKKGKVSPKESNTLTADKPAVKEAQTDEQESITKPDSLKPD